MRPSLLTRSVTPALLCCVHVLAACLGPSALLAPAISEPNTRPARNVTSFTYALHCMDGLLAQSGRRSVLISSNGFPDNTDDLDVGADDMLINAINQLNRSNRKYVFLDQAHLKDFGQLEILTSLKDDEIKPQMYIRGSISQIDERTSSTGGSADFGGASGADLTNLYFRGTRNLSIVTVDMHLVEYPSRRIIPGGSVANSMVVMQRRLDGSIIGLIDKGTLGISLYIDKVESKSQAVRNLIEVGTIELLGRHSGVPYWSCLDAAPASARRNEVKEKRTVRQSDTAKVAEAQEMLAAMGLLASHDPGELDGATRRAISAFQGRNSLLPNGLVDFDTVEELRRQSALRARTSGTTHTDQTQTQPARTQRARSDQASTSGTQQKSAGMFDASPLPPVTAPTSKPASKTRCPKPSSCDDHYLNLYDFIKNL